jgi:hypothetical protein
MDILVSHFPFHCFGQSSKDMSECSSDQLDQSVRIGGCFICVREWLARAKAVGRIHRFASRILETIASFLRL